MVNALGLQPWLRSTTSCYRFDSGRRLAPQSFVLACIEKVGKYIRREKRDQVHVRP